VRSRSPGRGETAPRRRERARMPSSRGLTITFSTRPGRASSSSCENSTAPSRPAVRTSCTRGWSANEETMLEPTPVRRPLPGRRDPHPRGRRGWRMPPRRRPCVLSRCVRSSDPNSSSASLCAPLLEGPERSPQPPKRCSCRRARIWTRGRGSLSRVGDLALLRCVLVYTEVR
jgi:hypothetical protein